MWRINTPLNQIRLTNVAIVRIKKHGLRFEIACYKNKILNWRSGIETNLDEVLQIKAIFHNVSKGEYAKKESMNKAFGTEDIETIARVMLNKGKLQVSEKEREVLVEQVLKDICNLVSLFTVNPNTGFPLTLTMIESAVKELGYSVQLDQSPKKQALKIVDIMQSKSPNQISRALMRLRVSCSLQQKEKLRQFLSIECFSIFENDLTDDKDSSLQIKIPDPPSSSQNSQEVNNAYTKDTLVDNQVDNSNITKPPKSTNENTQNYSVIILCPPKYYRQIDDFVMNSLKPSGSLYLLASNVKGLNTNLDNQNTSTLNYNSKHFNLNNQENSNDEITPQVYPNEYIPEAGNNTKASSIKSISNETPCGVCFENFLDTKSYRDHCKDERHILNLKRKLKNLSPFNESEYFIYMQQFSLEEKSKSKVTKSSSKKSS